MNWGTKSSLTLNALLLGFVIWRANVGERPGIPANFSRNLKTRGLDAKQQPTMPPITCEPGPEILEVSEPFQWGQLESTDYRVYLANLRAIGCPEPTARDIIIADINDLFAPRVRTLVDEVSGRFWELTSRPESFDKMVKEKHTQLRALQDERDEIFTALFGDKDPRLAGDQEGYPADRRKQWERIADFLSEEKRGWFVAAGENLERAWADFLRTPGLTDAQRQAKRQELEAACDQTLREEFTTEEYHELRLRQSPAASLRDRLVGLDWSEETVRAVANLQFAKASVQAALPRKDADFAPQLEQLRQQSETQMRELLGEDSYVALQRAMDNRYEPIYRVAQRLALPDATAAQAYDIRRLAGEAANQVQADKSLAAEERQTLLQAIGTETRQSLATTLGSKGLAAYEKIAGDWTQQFIPAKR